MGVYVLDLPAFILAAVAVIAAVWHLADFLLQGFVFLLVGQQIAPVVRGLRASPAGTIIAAAAISIGVVLLLRPLWLALTQTLPRPLPPRRGPPVPAEQHLSRPESPLPRR